MRWNYFCAPSLILSDEHDRNTGQQGEKEKVRTAGKTN